MGLPEVAEKCRKPMTQDGHRHRRRSLRRPDPGAPTAAAREILPEASSGGGAHPWPARVQGGWPESPPTAGT